MFRVCQYIQCAFQTQSKSDPLDVKLHGGGSTGKAAVTPKRPMPTQCGGMRIVGMIVGVDVRDGSIASVAERIDS